MQWKPPPGEIDEVSDWNITPLVRHNFFNLVNTANNSTPAFSFVSMLLQRNQTDPIVNNKKTVEHLTGLKTDSQHIAKVVTAELIPQHCLNHRMQLETAVVASSDSHILLQCIDFDMSDETPMFVSRGGDLQLAKHSKNSSTALVATTGLSKQQLAMLPRMKTNNSEQITKILQSIAKSSMLIQNKVTSEFIKVDCQSIHCLQHLERTTAECLVHAREMRSKPSAQVSAFESKTRIHILDQAASNPRYVHGLPNPDGSWKNITFFCDDHIIFNVIGDLSKTFVDRDISGLTHWALTFNHSLGRAYSSKIVREIVHDWLVVKKGPPPLEARNRSKAILRIALIGQSNNFETRLHMECWPNGDPFKRGQIEVWLPIGTEIDRGFLVEAVSRAINFIAFSRNQPIIKRHRWRGIYPGMSAYVLLDNLFGLAPELLKRFRQAVKQVAAPSSISSRAASASAAAKAGSAAANASESSVPLPGDEDGTNADPETSRCKAQAWVDSNPGARCKAFRMAIEPIRQYQESKAHACSLQSQRRSQIIDVLALQGHPNLLTKQIPFYLMISGQLEQAALRRLSMLLTSTELWTDLMSSSEATLENQELAFRMIARGGSQLNSKLLNRSKLQPTKTLLVDLRPELEKEIVNDSCDHMHTAWSLDHCASHLGDVSAEARRTGFAKRVHISDTSTSTIMELENLHASFRRRLKAAGVQTHKVTFVDLSAAFVCDRARSRESQHAWRDSAAPANHSSVDDSAEVDANADEHPVDDGNDRDYERGGGGGVWRAFIRDQTLGSSGTPDIRALADQYNNHTSEAELERLAPIAAQATERHAAGTNTSGSKTSSFGPTTREMDRALLKRKAEAMWQQLSDEAKTSLASMETSAFNDSALQAALQAAHEQRRLRGGTFDAALKEGRFVLMNYSNVRVRRIKELEDMVRTWCQENCNKLLDTLIAQVPLLH